MRRQNRRLVKFAVFLLCFSVAFLGPSVQPAQASANDGHGHKGKEVVTIDHFVPHVSTVPGNQGEEVELFVRERVVGGNDHHSKHTTKPVVLMVLGAVTSAVPVFDARFENYSWMEFLAEAGFDVFAVDLTGYGLSPRPMMDDPCNASRAEQQAFLVPNPLDAVCPPGYPFRLSTIQSDWDEIDTVVDFLRELRDVDRVHLVSWSRGGLRSGGYAARHPEKVDKLFLYAPASYVRQGPSDPPAVLPQPGVPMTVLGSAAFFNGWDAQVKCQNQFNPGIRDVIRPTMLEFDPLGSTWGRDGVIRAPLQNSFWGWNSTFARRVQAPTLIIRGDLDTIVPIGPPTDLFEDLQTQKVFVHVACASHQLVWESQHMSLLRASVEWLHHGTFAGHQTGTFFVDRDGQVHQETPAVR